MEDELVTVAIFDQDYETLLIEPLLQSEDIYYFLQDQKTVAIDPLISHAIGGIKLLVKKKDAERTMALLQQIQASKEAEQDDRITIHGKQLKKVRTECPFCDSDKVYTEQLDFFQVPDQLILCQNAFISVQIAKKNGRNNIHYQNGKNHKFTSKSKS